MNAATARLLVEAKWVNCMTENCIGKEEMERAGCGREREREKDRDRDWY